jgi:uncharacterized RDD family membrane protein YckC
MNAKTEASLAPLWLRLTAAVYDFLPLLGLWFVATGLVLLATGGGLDVKTTGGKLLVQSAVVLVTAAYFLASWLRGGATIGMRAWRLRVVRADGTALTLPQALLRFAVGWISVVALGAGFWWCLIDREKRSWHDLAAGTVLVRVAR